MIYKYSNLGFRQFQSAKKMIFCFSSNYHPYSKVSSPHFQVSIQSISEALRLQTKTISTMSRKNYESLVEEHNGKVLGGYESLVAITCKVLGKPARDTLVLLFLFLMIFVMNQLFDQSIKSYFFP